MLMLGEKNRSMVIIQSTLLLLSVIGMRGFGKELIHCHIYDHLCFFSKSFYFFTIPKFDWSSGSRIFLHNFLHIPHSISQNFIYQISSLHPPLHIHIFFYQRSSLLPPRTSPISRSLKLEQREEEKRRNRSLYRREWHKLRSSHLYHFSFLALYLCI